MVHYIKHNKTMIEYYHFYVLYIITKSILILELITEIDSV